MFGTLLFTTLFVALCVFKRRPQPVLELSYDSLPRDSWDESNASPDWFYLACEYPQTVAEAPQTSNSNFEALMSLADDATSEDSEPGSPIGEVSDYSSYSLSDLRTVAKLKKVHGWSRLRKAELLQAVQSI